jgi:hypothetical protein
LSNSASAELPPISGTDSISGDNPGLAYPPTFVLFIPAPVAFEANNQFIKVSHRIRTVRKAPDVKRLAGCCIIRDSICADVEHGLSPMNVLAMNLTSERVDDRYLKILIVGKTIFVKVLCEDSAMCNRVGIGLELQSNPISHGNAIFHIKEELLHSHQPWFVLVASQLLFLNNTRSDTAICRY